MGSILSKTEPLPNSFSDLNNDLEDLDPDERSSTLHSKYNQSSAIKIERTNSYYDKYLVKKKKSPRDDLGLAIDAHLATLLKASPNTSKYGSSLDSDMSPVFTTNDAKDDLVSSLSSSPNKPDFDDTASDSLEPIIELSGESTPVPKSSDAKHLIAAKDLIVLNVEDLNLDKLSLTSSTSESPDSNPTSFSVPLPSVSVNNKNAFPVDIDGIIERLISIGSSKRKPRKSRQKFAFTNDEIKYVLTKSRAIFASQPTLLKLSPPVKVVGDLHGQFEDLIRIFNKCGFPPYSNYLFLGDYVDRGHKSLETILLLLCYKIKYPENFFMLRGNHESANVTKIYGFYDECIRRLSSLTGRHKIWKNFVDVFNTLPIAATINDKIFCIHGGLSPDLVDLSQIQHIKRPTDIPDKGLLADLLWSDPDPSIKTFSMNNWPKNDRGVSYCFGKKHVDHFCQTFGFDLIVRGHMVVEDGYEFFNNKKFVTVFSAPNYCGEFNNYGAVMNVDTNLCCSFDMIKPKAN